MVQPQPFSLHHSFDDGDEMMRGAVGSLVALMGACAPVAQAPAPESRFMIFGEAKDTAYFERFVDTPIVPIRNPRGLEYPDILRMKNVEGRVLIEFVVDTAGHVVPQTIRVRQATDPLFEKSVRTYIRTARFHPALLNGRKVNEHVEVPFEFTLSRVP